MGALPLQSCALRALTLCDGQRLEEPDHALTECPCKVLSDATRYELHETARAVLDRSCEAHIPLLPF